MRVRAPRSLLRGSRDNILALWEFPRETRQRLEIPRDNIPSAWEFPRRKHCANSTSGGSGCSRSHFYSSRRPSNTSKAVGTRTRPSPFASLIPSPSQYLARNPMPSSLLLVNQVLPLRSYQEAYASGPQDSAPRANPSGLSLLPGRRPRTPTTQRRLKGTLTHHKATSMATTVKTAGVA